MKILVTGSTGFIGSYLVRLLEKDNHIQCIVRDNSQIEEPVNRGVIKADLSQPLDINLLPDDVEVIIHLAQANVPFPEKADELFQVNTASTQALLEYGRRAGIMSFIYASSGSVYGFGKRAFVESDAPHPLDYYSLTKYCSELLVKQYEQYFNTAILRFFAPYGKGQKNRLFPRLIGQIRKGEEVIIYNKGNPKMNPIYVLDVIEAIRRALPLSGHHTINVGGQEASNIKGLADLMGELLGTNPRYRFLSDSSKQDMVGDITYMKTLLDFEPNITLRHGLELAID